MTRENFFIAAFLLVVSAAAVMGAYRGFGHDRARSLGQDWECSTAAYADVCVKKVAPPKVP